jgi:hypothetical protein
MRGRMETGMEIFYREINKGQLNFEVSVHDNTLMDGPLSIRNEVQPPFHVYITARDESSRKIWRTPLMTNGIIKDYYSIDEALEDASKKIS